MAGNFVKVPIALLDAVADPESDLDGFAIAVWVALRSYADFGSEEGAVVRDEVAAVRAGCSWSTFKRRRKSLQKSGWLDWQSNAGRSNRYIVRDAPDIGLCDLGMGLCDLGIAQTDLPGSVTEAHIPRVKVPRTNTSDLEPKARRVFDYWRDQYEQVKERAAGPKKKPTDKRIKKVRARIKEGYTVEQLCEAIDGCFSKSFNVENGHLDLELICRDDAHVSQYRIAAKKNGKQPDDSIDQTRAELDAIRNVGASNE